MNQKTGEVKIFFIEPFFESVDWFLETANVLRVKGNRWIGHKQCARQTGATAY